MVLAVAPITDITLWVRSSGLLIVLYVTGAISLSRVVQWLAGRIAGRIDARSGGNADITRSETARHSQTVIQVITWAVVVLISCFAAVLVLQRLYVPLTGFVAQPHWQVRRSGSAPSGSYRTSSPGCSSSRSASTASAT